MLADVEPDTHFSGAEDMVAHVAGRARPGSIILLQVEMPQRAQGRLALPGIVAALRTRGYHFVTLSGLMGTRAP